MAFVAVSAIGAGVTVASVATDTGVGFSASTISEEQAAIVQPRTMYTVDFEAFACLRMDELNWIFLAPVGQINGS